MKSCPCGNTMELEQCCGPYLQGKANPPTAEALMRARYTAFTQQKIDFIGKTYDPLKKDEFDEMQTTLWSKNADWKGLEILNTEAGGPGDERGVVEFVAHYNLGGSAYEHQEKAEFRFDKEKGVWYFVDGETVPRPIKRVGEKVGRNDDCPCGSGKKYKKCCLKKPLFTPEI